MGAYFSARGVKMDVLVKALHNNYFDQFVNKRRIKLGYPPIYIHEGIKKILTSLKMGRVVVFVADQDARNKGIFVNFFGVPASTFVGPAFFHLRTGAPILPVFDVRVGLTKHKIIIAPPIAAPDELNEDNKILFIMQKYNDILERIIREYPDQYFWFHRRWKTQPKSKKE